DILGLGNSGPSAAQGGRPPGAQPRPMGGDMPPQSAAQPTGGDISAALPSKILSDDRTNTLIVLSNEAGYLRVKALVDRLDLPMELEAGGTIHVYALQNADAEKLATTLNQALQGQGQKTAGAAGAPPPPGQPQPARTPGAPDVG